MTPQQRREIPRTILATAGAALASYAAVVSGPTYNGAIFASIAGAWLAMAISFAAMAFDRKGTS